MDSFEWNKVAAAVLVGVLLIMVINLASESLYHVDEANPDTYVVEGIGGDEDTSMAEVFEEQGPSLAALLADASADAGARQFRVCSACHDVAEGAPHKAGPNLHNIVGAVVGGKDGYAYSDALANNGGTWTYELLFDYLGNPGDTIPGNRMAFAGVRRESNRADLILYLMQNSVNPPPLPEVVEDVIDTAEDVIDAVEDAAQ